MEGAELFSELSWSEGVKGGSHLSCLGRGGCWHPPDCRDFWGFAGSVLFVGLLACLFAYFFPPKTFLQSPVCILLHGGKNSLRSFLGPEIVPGWMGMGATWLSGKVLE